jgi:hydroxyacyl-ACP dehydratase HTD2-like protein with hotdog domain
MLSALRASLAQVLSLAPSASKGAAGERQAMPYVKSLNYRNLAPLYVGEEMKVCLRRGKAEGDELGWDVWIEGPEGGLAVKGRAVTTGVAQTA